jgi:hypothetical protein
MKLYILQVFDIEYKDDILLALTTAEITRATVVEGLNMEGLLDQDFPLFSGLFRSQADRARYSQIIFGTVDDDEAIDAFLTVLKQAGIDNSDERVFRLVTMPVEHRQ